MTRHNEQTELEITELRRRAALLSMYSKRLSRWADDVEEVGLDAVALFNEKTWDLCEHNLAQYTARNMGAIDQVLSMAAALGGKAPKKRPSKKAKKKR